MVSAQNCFSGLLSFNKKSAGTSTPTGANQQLGEELHKKIIEKFKKHRVYSSFKYFIGNKAIMYVSKIE